MVRVVIIGMVIVAGVMAITIKNPLESATAYSLARSFDERMEQPQKTGSSCRWLKKIQELFGHTHQPDYCAAVLQEAQTLDDALDELNQPGAVYCPGFDDTTHACFLKKRAIRQAIVDCFSTSYFDTRPYQIQST